MFRIFDNGTGWCVTTEWHGAERVVFRGSVFECLRFVRQAEGK